MIPRDLIDTACTLYPLTEEVMHQCKPFTCGEDDDMDDFFRNEALDYAQYRMGYSYCFRLDEDPAQIVACFTLANDSMRIYDLPNARRNAMWSITNHEKMLNRFPGVLIGRLAVAEGFHGVGSQVIRFLRRWLYMGRDKAASRLLMVDAKNTPKVTDFYIRNGFKFLFPTEMQEDLYARPPKDKEEEALRRQAPRQLHTRLMYLDLLKEQLQNEEKK